jgi:hypothetical protein
MYDGLSVFERLTQVTSFRDKRGILLLIGLLTVAIFDRGYELECIR